MTYGLEIDLTGCDWWDGGPIRLAVSLSRLDANGESRTTSIALCGGRIIADDGTGEPPARLGTNLRHHRRLEHPPAEIAFYKGEVTYPWRDGDVTVEFQAPCGGIGTAAKCQNVSSAFCAPQAGDERERRRPVARTPTLRLDGTQSQPWITSGD